MSRGDGEEASLAATVTSLKEALQCNTSLQAKLAKNIQILAEKKARNRRLASGVTRHLVNTWDKLDSLAKPAAAPPLPSLPSGTDEGSTSREQSNAHDQAARKRYVAKWQYDPYRRWTRRYFVDPDASIPEDNDETSKRRKVEASHFFYHTSPPWTSKETQTLCAIVDETTAKKYSNISGSATVAVDFDLVASLLDQRMKHNGGDKRRPTSAIPRTGDECQLRYLDSHAPKSFTKKESLRIVEQVHLQNIPSWEKLSSDHTAWQCLVGYQTKLSGTQTASWKPREDELLLKYVAAMGPQWVLNLESAARLSIAVLPDKTPKQIITRANATLVNPNFIHDLWTDEEERRLCLCMKVYRDAPSQLTRAAVHFAHRSSSSISQKWQRSLNPEYSTKPFTKAEDEALLTAAARSDEAPWTDLAPLFPSRHPRTLYSRWKELAGKEDVLKRYGHSLKSQQAGNDGPLSSDDFVIRMKPAAGAENEGGGEEGDATNDFEDTVHI